MRRSFAVAAHLGSVRHFNLGPIWIWSAANDEGGAGRGGTHVCANGLAVNGARVLAALELRLI